MGILNEIPAIPERVFIGWSMEVELGQRQDLWTAGYWLALGGGLPMNEAYEAANTAAGFWGYWDVGRYFIVYCNPVGRVFWQYINFSYPRI